MKLKPSPPVVGPRRPGFNFFVANLYIVNMDASKNKPRGFRGFVFKLKRSAWVRSTLSGLVGTTLGIILTFGTKTCADNVAKERTAATTTKMVMRHLNTTTNQYAKMAAEMERTDSIFKYIYDLYPDSLAYADKDKAHRFCNVFGSSGLYAGNESTEKIFNSMATWESIKDKEFIDFIGTYFSLVGKMDAMLDETNSRRMELFYDIYTSDEFYATESAVEGAAVFIRRHDVRAFLARYSFLTNLVSVYAKMLKAVQTDYMKKVGLTMDDLYETTDTVVYEIDEKTEF